MSTSAARGQTARTIRLVTIPAEHGAWSFTIEPILLGLLLAPSAAGPWLAVATFCVFLVRQPLKLLLADVRGGKRYPRTVLAGRFVLLYGLVALVSAIVAFVLARGPFWLPIIVAAPIALVQIYFDMLRQSRDLLPELAGTVAIGASASAIALAGGWSLGPALALWAVLAVRAVTSIVYVRARLRLERGGEVDVRPAWALQVAGCLFAALLVYLGFLPWLGLLAVLILAARAVWGLSPLRIPARAQIVGIQELAFGLLSVALVALGYAFHI